MDKYDNGTQGGLMNPNCVGCGGPPQQRLTVTLDFVIFPITSSCHSHHNENLKLKPAPGTSGWLHSNWLHFNWNRLISSLKSRNNCVSYWNSWTKYSLNLWQTVRQWQIKIVADAFIFFYLNKGKIMKNTGGHLKFNLEIIGEPC